MRVLNPLLLALLPICLAACDPSRPAATEAVRAQLVGTWLGESTEDGIKTRTVVALAASGDFKEFEKIDDGKGSAREAETSGEWSFDGTNFKRKYTRQQGQALPLKYLTTTSYAIHMTGDRKFVGVDNLRHRAISFTRAESEVRP